MIKCFVFVSWILLPTTAAAPLLDAAPQLYPNRPITLVCPWNAGGGTDACSRQIAIHLETELGIPVNVINATGGKGVTGHSRGLYARPDGYTITMATLELNMMHWSKLTKITHEDFTLLMSINEDYAALLVRKDAPWHTLSELVKDVRAEPRKLKCSGTANGGAWHLALAGWLINDGGQATDITWISSTGAGPSLLELMSGGIDMVCCSLPEADPLLRSGQVRALGAMAPERVRGYEDVPTFKEQGVDWSLVGWRGLAVPKETPQEIVDVLVAALEKIVTGRTQVDGQTFPDFMHKSGYDNTWRPPDDFRRFVAKNDEKFGKLLTRDDMRSVNKDPFNPMAFPGALMVLLGITFVAILFSKSTESTPEPSDASDDSYRKFNYVVVLLAIAAYAWLADSIGYVIVMGVILYCLLLAMGSRAWISAIVTLCLVPATYQLFAHVLRVPLPRGVFGW